MIRSRRMVAARAFACGRLARAPTAAKNGVSDYKNFSLSETSFRRPHAPGKVGNLGRSVCNLTEVGLMGVQASFTMPAIAARMNTFTGTVTENRG